NEPVKQVTDLGKLLKNLDKLVIKPEIDLKQLNTWAFLAYHGDLDEFEAILTKNAIILMSNRGVLTCLPVDDLKEELKIPLNAKQLPFYISKKDSDIHIVSNKDITENSKVLHLDLLPLSNGTYYTIKRQDLGISAWYFFRSALENVKSQQIVKNMLINRDFKLPAIKDDYIKKWDDIQAKLQENKKHWGLI
ncbi:hypothetical protein M153_12610001, partial [Pseudoloma neurophilia]